MIASSDYLIIGGGIAGITAAEAIRENDRSGSIAIFSDEPHFLYSRVLLPSYLKGKIKRSQVFLRTADDFDAKNIRMFAGEEVLELHPDRREIALGSGVKIGYRKLLIAAGGRPREIPFAAGGLEGVFRLQSLDDADRIYDALSSIKNPLVVGGGFISLEFLEILASRGLSPRLLYKEPRFFSKWVSEKGSGVFHKNFLDHGIEAISGDEVGEVIGAGRVEGVRTLSGREIACDSIFAGVGIARNLELLSGIGIKLGVKGITVNEYLETSIPDVFAAGDIAEVNDSGTGEMYAMGNWNQAFLGGQRVGEIMSGIRRPFRMVPHYALSNLGLHISAIGNPVGRSSAIRCTEKPLSYAEFFAENGIIKGAVLVNAPRHQPLVQSWIASGRNISGIADDLRDPGKDLAELSH